MGKGLYVGGCTGGGDGDGLYVGVGDVLSVGVGDGNGLTGCAGREVGTGVELGACAAGVAEAGVPGCGVEGAIGDGRVVAPALGVVDGVGVTPGTVPALWDLPEGAVAGGGPLTGEPPDAPAAWIPTAIAPAASKASNPPNT